MSQRLNKWQKEILKLKSKDDKRIAFELRKIYRRSLLDIRDILKEIYADYDNQPYWKIKKFEKMQLFEAQIVQLLNDSYEGIVYKVYDFATDKGQKGFDELFYGFEIQQGFEITFNQLPMDEIRNLVEQPVAGKRLSQRLYENRDELARKVNRTMQQGFIEGISYAKMAKRLSMVSEADYKKAVRIARTEGARVYGLAKQQSYDEAKSLGIEAKKMWLSALDTRTRSSHQHLDGQVVGLDEYFVTDKGHKALQPAQFGIASEDIYCRCSTIEIINDYQPTQRRARKYEDGVEVGTEKIPFMTYEEWKENRFNKE